MTIHLIEGFSPVAKKKSLTMKLGKKATVCPTMDEIGKSARGN